MTADDADRPGVLRGLLRRGEVMTALMLAVTLAALVPVALATDTGRLFDALGRTEAATIGAVLALALANYALRVVRFDVFLRRLGMRLPARAAATVYVAGFAMSATPGKVGELLRLWLLRRAHGLAFRRTFPVLVADRAGDVMAMLLLCVAGLAAFADYAAAALPMAALWLAAVALLVQPRLLLRLVGRLYALVGRRPRLFARLRALLRATAALFRPRPLAQGLVLGVAGWFCECVALYVCAATFSADITLLQAVFVFAFANLVGGLTLVPGGIGGTEVTMVALLLAAGLDLDAAVATTTIVRLGTLWFGIACGYVVLLSGLAGRRFAGDREQAA
ncbi:MAG: YbhN family protein [Alphaproteobacteria bacterium]